MATPRFAVAGGDIGSHGIRYLGSTTSTGPWPSARSDAGRSIFTGDAADLGPEEHV